MTCFIGKIYISPIAGPGRMSPEEGVKAVQLIKPEVVIPMHYGTNIDGMAIGSSQDGDLFYDLIEKSNIRTKVILL